MARHHSSVLTSDFYRALGLCVFGRAPHHSHVGLYYAQPARVGLYVDALLGERSERACVILADLGGPGGRAGERHCLYAGAQIGGDRASFCDRAVLSTRLRAGHVAARQC